MTLRIAIISDPHAHNYRPESRGSGLRQNSRLIADKSQDVPELQAPFKSLFKLIKKENLTSDIMFLPGDFCDLSDAAGFQFAWENSILASSKLKCSEVIGTVGNHDVQRGSHNPFNLLKVYCNFNNFPILNGSDRNSRFWTDGYVIYTIPKKNCDILIINSSFHHGKSEELQRGKLDDEQLESIREELENRSLNKFKICITHHPPLPHEKSGNSSTDFMKNGSELIKILDEYDFNLYVYGHKHDSMIRYSTSGSGSTALFSGGSFGCLEHKMIPNVKNTFHIIELEDQEITSCDKQGIIKTWYFVPTKGWVFKNLDEFPKKFGFGCTLSPKELAKQTLEYLQKNSWNDQIQGYIPISWNTICDNIPHLNYIIPDVFRKYGRLCDKLGISMKYELPDSPDFIYLKK